MNRKYNQFAIISVVVLAVLLFIYNDFICSSQNCYELEVALIEPLFYGTLGLIPTLLILLWRGEVFLSWLKHIAWWFIPAVFILVGSNENESDFSIFADDISIVAMSMSVLFVITIIYSIVMKGGSPANNA